MAVGNRASSAMEGNKINGDEPGPHPSASSGNASGNILSESTIKPWSVEAAVSGLSLPAPSAPSPTIPISFFHVIERLKTTKREGWRRFGITTGESISDHMYRMSIMTMLAPPTLLARLDIPRCTKMALVHDMAECLVGDITPVDGVSKAEKSRREAATMDYLTKSLLGNVAGGLAGRQLQEIWEEYEESRTLESQFVHDIDKMELLLQMVEYERTHGGRIDLGEFAYVANRIVLPEVQRWSDEVLQEQAAFWKEVGDGKDGGAQETGADGNPAGKEIG